MSDLTISKITLTKYSFVKKDLGTDYNGFNLIYEPGATLEAGGYVLTIETAGGLKGEFVGGQEADYSQLPKLAKYLLGRNALERERFYSDISRALRQVARIGLAPLDCALWDLAGKAHEVPLYRLLGGFKAKVPCYASTFHGDEQRNGLIHQRPMPNLQFNVEKWGIRPSRFMAGAKLLSQGKWQMWRK